MSDKTWLVFYERRDLRNTVIVLCGVIYTLSCDLKLKKSHEIFSQFRRYPYGVWTCNFPNWSDIYIYTYM